MPIIQPISDLRNYSTVLEKVQPGTHVYLTKNGHGAYAVIDIADHEDYMNTKAALKFMCEMNRGLEAGDENGWLSADEIRNHIREKHHAMQS